MGLFSSRAATIYWPRDYFHGWRLQTGPPRLIALVAQPSTPTTRPGLSSSRAASIYWPRDYFQGWHLQTGPPPPHRPRRSANNTNDEARPLSTRDATIYWPRDYFQGWHLQTGPPYTPHNFTVHSPTHQQARRATVPRVVSSSNRAHLKSYHFACLDRYHTITACTVPRVAATNSPAILTPRLLNSQPRGFSASSVFYFLILPFFSAPMMLLQGCVARHEID